MRQVVFSLLALCASGTISPSDAQQSPPDVCAILANRLQPDILIQGSSSQQFSQLQQVLSDQRYDDFASASSSDHSFSLGFSVPQEVDLAIGDNQKSNNVNWQSRRNQFLSMNFQQTSSAFQQSSYISQTSTALIHEISICAQTIANSRASGVYVNMDMMSPDRDSFAIQLSYRTDGNPNDWKLTDFHVNPPDPSFKCQGFEQASDSHKIPLVTLKKEIGCSKSSDAHLTLVINTNQGGATAIALDSIDERLQKLRDELDNKITNLSTRLEKSLLDATNSVSGLESQLKNVGPDVYQCPTSSSHGGGSLGGGSWGFYGCQGQITTENYCVVIEFPKSANYPCTTIGKLRLAP